MRDRERDRIAGEEPIQIVGDGVARSAVGLPESHADVEADDGCIDVDREHPAVATTKRGIRPQIDARHGGGIDSIVRNVEVTAQPDGVGAPGGRAPRVDDEIEGREKRRVGCERPDRPLDGLASRRKRAIADERIEYPPRDAGARRSARMCVRAATRRGEPRRRDRRVARRHLGERRAAETQEGELGQCQRREPIAARLVAREQRRIDQRDHAAARSEMPGRRRAGRSCADDGDVEIRTGAHGVRRRSRPIVRHTADHALTVRESAVYDGPRGSMSIAARPWLGPEPMPHAGTLRTEGDARRYVRRTFVLTISLYGVLAAALGGLGPWWALLVAVPWLYVRLALALHELLHACAPDGVPAFHRLAMIFDTPVSLGFREHREIHLDHHRYGVDRRDPERAQIEGSHVRALAMALSTPERALVHRLRTRGLDAPLARQAGLRLVVFCALLAANPAVFALYWLVLRASIGASGYVFHHVLHNRRGVLGTYALPVSVGIARAGRAFFGEEPMLILARHPSHHLWPEVRVRDLPALPASFDLPEGPVTLATLAAARQTLSAPPSPARRP